METVNAFLRSSIEVMGMGIPQLWIMLNDEDQGLHDVVAGTFMVAQEQTIEDSESEEDDEQEASEEEAKEAA
ncbi:MAG: hypothetical protein ABEJ65_01445 [bacterium]